MKNEIWKPIAGFEGFYEVSNMGRVRSLDRTVYFKNGKTKRDYKGQILKQKYHNGYALVNLNKNKNLSVLAVHILVAKAFVPNPNNLPIVNHKSGVKSDNCYTNLEWCTSAYNNKHAVENGLREDNLDGIMRINNENKVCVSCYKNQELIATKSCSRELAEFLIDNHYVEGGSVENLSRKIRKCSQTGWKHFGFTFIRHNEPKYTYKESGTIDVILNGVVLTTQTTSQECAEWLLKNQKLTNVSPKTLARGVRAAIKDNKQYHGFIFRKNNF